MNYKKELGARLVLLLVLPVPGVGIVPATDWLEQPVKVGDGTGEQAKPDNAQVDIQRIALDLYQSLPDGQTVEAKDFASVFPADTARKIESVGIISVSRTGGHVELKLSREYKRHLSRVDVRLETSVAFDLIATGDAVEIRQIKGVKVHANWFLGWMDLRDLTITKDQQGRTLLIAQVSIWFKPGKTTYKVTLGPDGKPLPKKQ